MSNHLVTILGPTACGKTALAVQLARAFSGEIISADSRQAYQYLDIGSGKDKHEYLQGGEPVVAHGIDIIDPEEEYDVVAFLRMFLSAHHSIIQRRHLPILVGGTGLYLSAVLQGYEYTPVDFTSPRYAELNQMTQEDRVCLLHNLTGDTHNTSDDEIPERTIRAIMIAEAKTAGLASVLKAEVQSVTLGLRVDRAEVIRRIDRRLDERLAGGMIEEAEALLQRGVTHEKLRFFGLEYKFLSSYLAGEMSLPEMRDKLAFAIHNFAKRQMTWYRRMEKQGVQIQWIDGPDFEAASRLIQKALPELLS